jgi:hypothetical protein
MQGNDTTIIVMTDKVKAFIGKLCLWVRKLEGKSLDMISRLKDFCGAKQCGKGNSGIHQCIKDHLVSLQSKFSKYFPEAVSDKCYVESLPNYDFSLEVEEKYIDIISDTFLKFSFL